MENNKKELQEALEHAIEILSYYRAKTKVKEQEQKAIAALKLLREGTVPTKLSTETVAYLCTNCGIIYDDNDECCPKCSKRTCEYIKCKKTWSEYYKLEVVKVKSPIIYKEIKEE